MLNRTFQYKLPTLAIAALASVPFIAGPSPAAAATQTYSVPLQFSLTLTAPTCSLTVGSSTATSTTLPSANVVTLTSQATSATPTSVLTALFTATPSGGIGTSSWLGTTTTSALPTALVPAASATCTSGTPYSISVTNDPAGATTTVASQANVAAGVGTTNLTSLGMGLTLLSVAGTAGTGATATWNTTPGSIAATANGSAQTIALQAIGGTTVGNVTPFGSASAGTYLYKFLVNLIF